MGNQKWVMGEGSLSRWSAGAMGGLTVDGERRRLCGNCFQNCASGDVIDGRNLKSVFWKNNTQNPE